MSFQQSFSSHLYLGKHEGIYYRDRNHETAFAKKYSLVTAPHKVLKAKWIHTFSLCLFYFILANSAHQISLPVEFKITVTRQGSKHAILLIPWAMKPWSTAAPSVPSHFRVRCHPTQKLPSSWASPCFLKQHLQLPRRMGTDSTVRSTLWPERINYILVLSPQFVLYWILKIIRPPPKMKLGIFCQPMLADILTLMTL